MQTKSNMRKPLNFQLGWPSTSLFPREELLHATQQTFTNEALSAEALIYGPDPGFQPLRKSLAAWLTDFYQPSAGPTIRSRIFLANGASSGLSIILDKFTDPIYTLRVWMVEPTYFLACPIFQDAGFEGRLRGVPEDEEGIDIQFLEKRLKSVTDRAKDAPPTPVLKSGPRYPKIFRHVIYAVPTFSNPSAKTMSFQRRKELIDLARRYDALIITDDVYDMLRWPADVNDSSGKALGPPPPRLCDVDRSMEGQSEWGNAVSNGTFSKIVAPGVRVSWIEGTITFIDGLAKHGATCSGGSPGHMSSVFMHNLLQSGALNKCITETLIPTYQARSQVMMKAIREQLEPLGVRVTTGKPYQEPDGEDLVEMGGFFTFLTLPEHLPPADQVAKVALKHYSLKIAHGQMMAVVGDQGSVDRSKVNFGRGIRLSWSWHNEEEIEEGVARLAEVLNDMQAGTVKETPPGAANAAVFDYV